jgi:hypothetical protein
MSRALSPGRMMLMNAQVDRHLREARLEHRSRYAPSGDDTGTDRIDVVEVEGGRAMSIWFSGKRFCAVRHHYDDDSGSRPRSIAGGSTRLLWRRCR